MVFYFTMCVFWLKLYDLVLLLLVKKELFTILEVHYF